MEEMKYGKLTISETDREFSKTINGNIFTVEIPLPTLKATIIAQTSRAIGGGNVNSYLPEDYEFIRMVVTLNHVIISHPTWWTGANKCPDEELLYELWEHFKSSEIKFQEFLKKNTREEKLDPPPNDG